MKIALIKWLLIGLSASIIIGGVLATALVLKPLQLLRVRREAQTQQFFASNLVDSVVPVHSTQQIPVSIAAQGGIQQVQLWVNEQLWAEENLNPPQALFQDRWDWTPSGEGEHELVLRYQLTNGKTVTSTPVHVFALSSLDVYFPVSYETQPEETLAGIADQFGTPLQRVLDANPDQAMSSETPLPAGTALQIPVVVPDELPAFPQSGEDPFPPFKSIELPSPSAEAGPPDSVQAAAVNLPPEALMPGFQIVGGKLKTPVSVDSLYLYYRLADAPWLRSPSDPEKFFHPGPDGLFGISLDLDLESLQKLPEPTAIDLEAWGWKGGELVFLGLYHDMVGGPAGSLSWPPKETQLKVLDYSQLGKSIFSTSINISGDQPTLTCTFHYVSSAPDASFMIWQVSTMPFFAPDAYSHLVQYGYRPGTQGEFTLNFRDYFKSPASTGSGDLLGLIQQAIGKVTNDMAGGGAPKATLWGFLPANFYVRAIPMSSSGEAGKPSNTVVVHFTPAGVPVETAGPIDGPVYDAKIVGFIPYRAADPAYGACFVASSDIKYCSSKGITVSLQDLAQGKITLSEYQQCTTLVPKGSLSCGCPGIQCSNNDSSKCGEFSLEGVGDCLQKGAEALGSALKAGYDYLAKAYNETVAFVKKMAAELNPLCIQAKLAAGAAGGETVTVEDVESVCQAVSDIAVTAVMTYFGLPPSLPDFDKLADEGLDYAIGIATSEMGFECNKQCRDLIKKGLNAVTSGENLFQAGLNLGADMAADELNKIGMNCDQKCKNLIKDGVQGKATFGQATDVALDQATNQIVQKLQSEGYACDPDCKDTIRNGLEQGNVIGGFASSASAPQPEPLYVPHPLAAEQQAVVRIELFRRWESASIPDADVAKCNLAVYNQASNANFSQPVTGKLFSDEGVELPVLEPGESMVVPVLLQRVPWFLPEGVSVNTPPPTAGVIYATFIDPELGSWHDFYRGAQLSITATGPQFLTLDGQGGTIALPCVSGETYQTTIPASP
ncbi:MAG: LysM peptidoglycan-binding domain-containing protein [Anaerolineales bacterium]